MENSMHWVLDVAFRADAHCIRRDQAPCHRAILRCIALRVQQQSHRKVVKTLGFSPCRSDHDLDRSQYLMLWGCPATEAGGLCVARLPYNSQHAPLRNRHTSSSTAPTRPCAGSFLVPRSSKFFAEVLPTLPKRSRALLWAYDKI